MRGMMRNERKNVTAALLLSAALLTAPIPAQARESGRGVRETGPSRAWVVRVLSWLGLNPGLGSIWEPSSANIDPNGQP